MVSGVSRTTPSNTSTTLLGGTGRTASGPGDACTSSVCAAAGVASRTPATVTSTATMPTRTALGDAVLVGADARQVPPADPPVRSVRAVVLSPGSDRFEVPDVDHPHAAW